MALKRTGTGYSVPYVGRSAWRGNMGTAAKPDLLILPSGKRNGAILNEPEARHQHCRAFGAPLALLPSEPR